MNHERDVLSREQMFESFAKLRRIASAGPCRGVCKIEHSYCNR